MRNPSWARSLYWRSVVSVSVCIAAVLLVQAVAVQLWLKSAPDSRQLRRFTREVAAEVGHALEANPSLDVQQYLDAHYPKPLATIYLVTARDGQSYFRGPLRPPEASISGAREYYQDNPRPAALRQQARVGDFVDQRVPEGKLLIFTAAHANEEARALKPLNRGSEGVLV